MWARGSLCNLCFPPNCLHYMPQPALSAKASLHNLCSPSIWIYYFPPNSLFCILTTCQNHFNKFHLITFYRFMLCSSCFHIHTTFLVYISSLLIISHLVEPHGLLKFLHYISLLIVIYFISMLKKYGSRLSKLHYFIKILLLCLHSYLLWFSLQTVASAA